MATAPRPHSPRYQGADRCAAAPSCQDNAADGRISLWPPVVAEILTVVLCGLSAVLLLVVVARHAWPVWWLVIAGMLLAWAGDALWTLGDHLVDAVAAHRSARTGSAHPGGLGEPRAPGSQAGEQR